MLALVEQSLANRSQAEKRADLLAARLTRLGLAATLVTFLVTGDLATAIAIQLVMACPCATVLAASTAVTAALANAARHQVLIKGGLYLERLQETDCICFDKTGTLTTDIPEVTEIITRTPSIKPERVLGLAAAGEAHNPHPLARALVKPLKMRASWPDRQFPRKSSWAGESGPGVDGSSLLVGNLPFMQEEGIDTRYFQSQAARLEDKGQSVLYLAKDGKIQGIIGISYRVRPEVAAVLAGLRQEGIREMHLISGDTEAVVLALSDIFTFEGSAGNLLPADKAHYVERLVAAGRRVAVVGDGVNDALALSKAQVGVAMGAGGAEAAIAAADIALADSDLCASFICQAPEPTNPEGYRTELLAGGVNGYCRCASDHCRPPGSLDGGRHTRVPYPGNPSQLQPLVGLAAAPGKSLRRAMKVFFIGGTGFADTFLSRELVQQG